MRRSSLALVIAAVLLMPAPSSAAPVTLNYAGSWGFLDPPSDAPAFHAVLGAYGITDGSSVSFSLTLNGGVADSDPNAGHGLYLGALVSAQLKVGALTLTCTTASCSSAVPSFLPPVGAAQVDPTLLRTVGAFSSLPPLVGGTFTPSFFDFRAGGQLFLTSDSLSQALANPAGWPTPLIMIGFQGTQQGSGLNLGLSNLQLVSVPEPGTTAAIASGLVAFALFRRRRSRRSK